MTTSLERHYPTSQALRETVRGMGSGDSTVLLSFSAGKDAIATWVALRESGFSRILPFYLYLVPELQFVEESLQYFERVFRTPILGLRLLRDARAKRGLSRGAEAGRSRRQAHRRPRDRP